MAGREVGWTVEHGEIERRFRANMSSAWPTREEALAYSEGLFTPNDDAISTADALEPVQDSAGNWLVLWVDSEADGYMEDDE